MNKNKVDKLRISVAPFVGPDSQLVETRWKVNENPGSDAEIAVPGLESVKLEISADLPKEGDYTGAITLIYSDKRFPVQIVVTRSRPKPAIKILELLATDANSLLKSDPEIRMTIEETAGLTWSLQSPKVTTLSLNEGGKAKIQAQFDKVNVFDDGQLLTSLGFQIGPNQTKQLKLTISKLEGSGEFSGTIRVGSADFLPVEQAFTIFVKKDWLIAAILILFGITGSFVLRLYYKRGR